MYRLSRIAIIFFLLFHSTQVVAQRGADTFRLYFDLDVPTLNEKMQKKIDLLMYNDKIITGSKLTIVGYADYLGSSEYNKQLSMKRAEDVRAYLVKYGINNSDITLCMGKGKIDRQGKNDPSGYPTDRRVDIVVNNKKQNTKPPITKRRDTIRKVVVNDIGEMSKLQPGSVFKLSNVYFPASRHVMKNESKPALEKLFNVLQQNPNLKISIEGHICCVHDAPDALDIDTDEPHLSYNRAKAIYLYLVNKGIDSTRLTYRGFGRKRPVVVFEQTEADAEQNRRVEIRITDN